MDLRFPPGSRPGARVSVSGPSRRVLLLNASLATRRDFWVCPGGGLEAGETREQAAHREVREETGLSITPGPPVWFRRHAYSDAGRDYDLYERYFVGHSSSEEVTPCQPDSYVRGQRWWSTDELLASRAQFTPRRLAELIAPVARGERPVAPFDCGV